MSKIGIIIKREYLTRVRKRTFLLGTILTPLLFVGLITGVTYLSVKNQTKEKIAIVDPQQALNNRIESDKTLQFEFDAEADTSNFTSKGYSAVLFAPNTNINTSGSGFLLITEKNFSLSTSGSIEDRVQNSLERNMIAQQLNIDPARIDSIKTQVKAMSFNSQIKAESTLKQSNSGAAYAIGYVSAFLIYITLFIYGTMVMRGVMEEKTNRIAEVVVSSVRPFQLMMGKILGIGAVGLTQFLIWIVLVIGITTVAGSFLSPETLQQVQDANQQMPGAAAQASELSRMSGSLAAAFDGVNWPLIVGCFLFYFLGGYLFYAALFAAVGSSVNEDPQDAQSLLLPITMPIVFAIVIMINAITNPANGLAVWSSMIPFFSPVVMMARLPFGVPGTVPWWQLGLSMALLVLGFIFTTWLAAKIYRTGILMYGKKPTWKEMIKWARRG